MILVDTSAWVEFDRATGGPADHRLTALIAGGGPLAVTDPVVMEVTAGARDDRAAARLRDLLLSFTFLPFDAAADFDAASRIYRTCRRHGVTPRGMVDCMIAAVAWRHRATLLACDANLARIAGLMGIELDAA